jgi:hypothetical protein
VSSKGRAARTASFAARTDADATVLSGVMAPPEVSPSGG